jgi:hypothetical protein
VPNSQSGITSLCHPWGAGPVKWLNEEVLGIKPTTPGFKTFDVVPHLGRSLTRVAGKTPTPHGEISASFDVNTGKCKVTAPAGTVGRIGIPKVEKTIAAIAVNGTKAWDGVYHAVTGIGSASQDSEFVYLSSVQPGTYSIEVSYSGNTPEYKEPPEKYAAQFIKQDKTTGGDWGGVYGKDGYVLCNYKGERNDEKALPTHVTRGERAEVILDIRNDEKALPSYVTSLEYFRAFPKSGVPDPQMWATETADKRALAPDKHNGAGRKATGYSNDQTMSLTIGIDGEREYQVALYFVDWNKNGCRQAVEMMDAGTLNQIAPVKIVDDFSGGAYLVYQYNKSAKFRINNVRGPIVSLSGIFFDPAPAGAQAAESGTDKDGFVPLFDGKTLHGWQTTGNWIVEQGGVVALHPRPGESGWQRYDAYLTTARKYKDFILDLEFKIDKGGNSGVFLRVGDRMSQVNTGFEIQILDTHGLAKPGNHDCGGVIGAAAPSKNMAKPAGQWNRYVITLQGKRLKVEMNGEQIHDLELDKSAVKDRPAEGYIGFQDEGLPVWYRNVRIKELK